MDFKTLLYKLVNEHKLVGEEWKQLINYVDRSQDWNIQTCFQLICEQEFKKNFAIMSAKSILEELAEENKIKLED